MATIKYRVARGDTVFSERVLLTALMKGNDKVRHWILRETTPQYFEGAFRVIADSIKEQIALREEPTSTRLYLAMKQHVQNAYASQEKSEQSEYTADDMLPGYLSVIDHIMAIDMPDADTIRNALSWLHRRYRR